MTFFYLEHMIFKFSYGCTYLLHVECKLCSCIVYNAFLMQISLQNQKHFYSIGSSLYSFSRNKFDKKISGKYSAHYCYPPCVHCL